MDAKEILVEVLDYYKDRVKKGLCTMEEMETVLKTMECTMDVYGTIEDFAKFYGVTEGNVRATINRKLIAKPKRRVLYPFHLFRKIVPEKWLNKK